MVKRMIELAEKQIMEFIASIVKSEELAFLLVICARLLPMHNVEQLAYFLLGRGRNGKGTLIALLKYVSGNYWCDLSIDHYTKAGSENADAADQRLYDARYARVLNSSEIQTTNSNGKELYFPERFFKNVTGQDPISARQLGTKRVAHFVAGTVLFQLNAFPKFTSTDVAIRERPVVLDFPYTFTSDEELLRKEPEKYKRIDTQRKCPASRC
jgi:phage/plasmid-associated DNA primase